MIKKSVLILFILCCISSVYAQKPKNKINPNGYNVFYYPNGVKSSEGYMKNGKPDGYWINYYPNGQKKSEGNRKNFLLDSLWIFYNELGDTTMKISYYLGKKNGWYYTYYTHLDSNYLNNTVKSKILYVEDKRNGMAYFYYPDGKLWREVEYKNNYIDGQMFEYAPDGRLITIILYRYGRPVETITLNRYDKQGFKHGLWREYYTNGRIKWEATYNHGKLDGYYKEYSGYGTLVKYLRYRQGKLIIDKEQNIKEKQKGNLRFVEEYYKNGSLKYVGTYVDTIPVGIHKYYDTTNKLIKAIWYDNLGVKKGEGKLDSLGRKTGKWILFYENGEIMAIGKFKNNLRTGTWKFFYKNGNLMQQGVYLNGKYNGQWIWYYPNGQVMVKQSYSNGFEDGQYIELSLEGDTIVMANYVEGVLDGPWYFYLGDYMEKGQYEQGRKVGVWKSYYMPKEKLMCIDNYEDGYLEGKHKCYYPNGKIKETGQYISGKKNGLWIYYTSKGYVFYTITYNYGQVVKIDGKKLEDVAD